MYDLDQVAVNITLRRQQLDWSMRKLAEKANLSASTISEAEGGKHYLRSDKLVAIAKALGCSIDDLLSIDAQDDKDIRWIELGRRLTRRERLRVMEYAEWRYEVQREQNERVDDVRDQQDDDNTSA